MFVLGTRVPSSPSLGCRCVPPPRARCVKLGLNRPQSLLYSAHAYTHMLAESPSQHADNLAKAAALTAQAMQEDSAVTLPPPVEGTLVHRDSVCVCVCVCVCVAVVYLLVSGSRLIPASTCGLL